MYTCDNIVKNRKYRTKKTNFTLKFHVISVVDDHDLTQTISNLMAEDMGTPRQSVIVRSQLCNAGSYYYKHNGPVSISSSPNKFVRHFYASGTCRITSQSIMILILK